MYPHRMRLRPPWEWQPPTLRRRFGYPGTIDAAERVWITVTPFGHVGVVSVNGRELGPVDEAAWDITALLGPRNQVEVRLPGFAGDPRAAMGEVALEVRRTAYLEAADVRVAPSPDGPRLAGACRVAGTAEGPLDFYLVCGRSTLLDRRVAAPSDVAFDLALPADFGDGAVRFDLVQGAVVWYTIERRFTPPATCP